MSKQTPGTTETDLLAPSAGSIKIAGSAISIDKAASVGGLIHFRQRDWQFQLLLKPKSICDPRLVFPLIGGIFRNFLHPSQVSAKRDRSNLIEKLKQLLCSIPPERDDLLKKVSQADTAAHLNDWVNSPGLRSPK